MIILFKDQLKDNIYCPISGLPFVIHPSLLIYKVEPCNHCFYYSYLIKAILIQNNNSFGFNKCPLCFTNIKSIPILLNKYFFN